MWNNLSYALLLVVLVLLLVLQLCSAVEKTAVKVDKDLHFDGVQLISVFFAIYQFRCSVLSQLAHNVLFEVYMLLAFWRTARLTVYVEKNPKPFCQGSR